MMAAASFCRLRLRGGGWRILPDATGPGRSDISLLHLAIATAGVALVGIVGDRRPLGARIRVLLAFILFGGLAIFGKTFLVRQLVFPLFGVQFGLYYEWVALLFTVMCCVGLVNAVNLADGKNGLVVGLCIGWLLLIMARSGVGDIPFMAVMLAGLLALLVMNLRGRLFLGDGGAYGLAAAIGLLTIRSYSSYLEDPATGLSAEVVVLLFLVPVLDSFRLTFVRLARGQSPMAGDRDQLHHHLQNRFGWPNGLYLYLLMALTPAALPHAFLLWAEPLHSKYDNDQSQDRADHRSDRAGRRLPCAPAAGRCGSRAEWAPAVEGDLVRPVAGRPVGRLGRHRTWTCYLQPGCFATGISPGIEQTPDRARGFLFNPLPFIMWAMQPVPPASRDRAGSTSDSAELVDPAEMTALVTYFEEGLAKLDRLGLAEAANYICWGLDILKLGPKPNLIDAP